MRFIHFAALMGLFALLAAGSSAVSQTTASGVSSSPGAALTLRADSMLRAADLQADVAVLRRVYAQLHPGLYRYNTPAQMDAAFRALEGEFQRDRTLAEAYLAFSVFAAKVKCGHTYANFYNQKKAVQDALFRAGRVPFYFRWLNKRMIITKSFAGDPRLQAGTEVLAINGRPVASILERLLTVARADGNNDAKRVAYMEVQGTDRFEAFDVFFPLFFPSSGPRMSLRLRNSSGKRSTEVEVQPLTFEERLASMKDADPIETGKEGPFFEFRFLDDHIAYLRMPTWALYNTKWNWKAFLEESFAALIKSGATDLVLDLRGNEGGNDVGDEIISHLITQDVPRQAVIRRVRYRKVPDDLNPYLDTWDSSFRDWGSAAIDSTDGFYRLRRDADDDLGSVIKPSPPRFAGRVWVLIGATNSSATFEFAQTVRQNRLGTLVGQPTGGNQRGINGGAFFFLRLPHSSIELDLPLIGQFPVRNQPDAGLQPDILVVPTVSDIARSRDVEMNVVRTQVRRARFGK
jgi:Peptidase family S41